MITASFRALAEIAEALPILKAMRLKKLERAVSFKLPTAFAIYLKAIFPSESYYIRKDNLIALHHLPSYSEE